jgi:hypothetical protein
MNFMELHSRIQAFNLQEEEEDDISWNLTTNVQYSSAYEAQFYWFGRFEPLQKSSLFKKKLQKSSVLLC